VSYYDYYQPEAYIPGKDMYIEKDALVNDEIDRLRHSATSALFERRDVIIVASVSCIYSLGDPAEYSELVLAVRPDMEMDRNEFIKRLIAISYTRNDMSPARDSFRVRGDTVEVIPASGNDKALRVEFFGDVIERVSEINVVTGELVRRLSYAAIYPATHYAVSDDKREKALAEIEREMKERVEFFESNHKYLEAQRISERTKYDLEMLREIGFCSGVENYSRVLAGREPGSTPYTLLDYFPKDFLLFVDESHVTLPQVNGMSGGDTARKRNLVDFGFRLPSAYDNRPLYFNEFEEKINQAIFVSATPGDYEREHSERVSEQLIRPTGLIDPEIEVRPIEHQVDDLLGEVKIRAARNERSLVTTLTRKMAEDLTDYLANNGVRVRYLHHEVETMERTEIIRDLRLGNFDVLVGINLLREGLDIPEVSLVAILDADKTGFLRSETSLIQTIGRAARNVNGKVIMYGDEITKAMRSAIAETNRRRKVQQEYNEAHGIIPRSVEKKVGDLIEIALPGGKDEKQKKQPEKKLSKRDREAMIEKLTVEMKDAARRLDFELAAYLRDKIRALREDGGK
jgi:excinuclease ABC subunit B